MSDHQLNTIASLRNRLYVARLRQQLTQRALADRMGVVQSTVSEYETGVIEPSLTSAIRWARALGFELTLSQTKDGAT